MSKGKLSTETGSGKPEIGSRACKPAKLILDPVRASPYGPAASYQPHHEAGQMTAPDHMPKPFKQMLASTEASTDDPQHLWLLNARPYGLPGQPPSSLSEGQYCTPIPGQH